MKIPDRVRYINKKFTNRLVGVIAGKRYSPIALVRHTGRKSGRSYLTPVITARVKDGFIFALTYGDHIDWYRNILASGQAMLTWHGSEFLLTNSQKVDPDSGRRSFPQPFSTILRWLGTADFFRMESQSIKN